MEGFESLPDAVSRFHSVFLEFGTKQVIYKHFGNTGCQKLIWIFHWLHLLTSLEVCLLPLNHFCWCWIPSGAAVIASLGRLRIASVQPLLPCTIRMSGVCLLHLLYPGCTVKHWALTCHLQWLCSGCIALCLPGWMTASSPAEDSASKTCVASRCLHTYLM